MSDPQSEITYLGDLQRLVVKPGDRFVLTTRAKLSREQVGHIRSHWEHFFPDTPLIVLEDGMRLGAIASED